MSLRTSLLFIILTAISTPLVSAQPGGGGGPGAPDIEILDRFDHDQNGRLNAKERAEALTYLELMGNQRGQRRRGGNQPAFNNADLNKKAKKVSPADVEKFADRPLYDTTTLRTIFLDFESEKWEAELAAFKPTDVEVPATMTVDGVKYPNVGTSFRGASSFFTIPDGLKRSFNLSMDFMDKDQRLYGYKSLNLLNCNGDPTMMSSFLYSHISSKKIATPKVNYVKVVVNGVPWGVYVSSQQFNKTFLKENYSSTKGARWKVSGSPRGDGGLRYLGDDIAPYRERFDIKSKDKDESWKSLINLCRVLNETPESELESALEPLLDIDGALWFLAVDVAVSNSDGYWVRASDYSIFKDEEGRFNILPHDMNECFAVSHGRRPGGGGGGQGGGPPQGGFGGGPPQGGPGGGPPQGGFGGGPPQGGPGGGPPQGGFGGGPPQDAQGGGRQRGRRFGGGGGARGGGGGHGGGVELDPLVGLDDASKPLRSVLLKNPKFKKQYLENIKTIAEMMAWKNISSQVKATKSLIDKEVKNDLRKLVTYEAYLDATSLKKPAQNSQSLRAFCEKRSKFLLQHEAVRGLKK